VAEGQDQAALVDFKKAISLEEAGEPYGSAWARTLWGRFLARRGHFVEAQQRYEEALKVLPGYPLALVQLGELETRTGQYARAEAHYNQVLARTQGAAQVFDHLVLRGLANLSYLKGDRPGTKNLLDRAEARLRHDMNAFGHRRELARLLLERGRPQDLGEVLSLMKVELTLRRDPETWDTQAWALMRAGRWSEAHQAMAAALKGGLRDASIFYRAGVIATQLEDTASAQQYFQQMRSTDPHFDANARQALGLVELNL
jgi:Tfp pilus assembly protein PilF